MDLRETLRSTGAARGFRPEPVDDDTVLAVLDDARFAPSGGNRQPWRVAIVHDAGVRGRIGAATRPVWEEYMGARAAGRVPFNVVDSIDADPLPTPNSLIDEITDVARVPVVLVVAADLSQIAAMDAHLDRLPITAGASLYPFCWSVLLSARAHGLGGVLTTFAARAEPDLRAVLALPEHWAVGATLFLGYPEHQPTKLKRNPPADFTFLDRFDHPYPGD